MSSTRPKDGTCRPDLFDPENPQVTLTLDADTARELRTFLQDNDVGKHLDDRIFYRVYRPLLEVEGAIRTSVLRRAKALDDEAKRSSGEAARLRMKADEMSSAIPFNGSP